jgi:hypothetical protein
VNKKLPLPPYVDPPPPPPLTVIASVTVLGESPASGLLSVIVTDVVPAATGVIVRVSVLKEAVATAADGAPVTAYGRVPPVSLAFVAALPDAIVTDCPAVPKLNVLIPPPPGVTGFASSFLQPVYKSPTIAARPTAGNSLEKMFLIMELPLIVLSGWLYTSVL